MFSPSSNYKNKTTKYIGKMKIIKIRRKITRHHLIRYYLLLTYALIIIYISYEKSFKKYNKRIEEVPYRYYNIGMN